MINHLYNGLFSSGILGYPKHRNRPIISQLLFPRPAARATTREKGKQLLDDPQCHARVMTSKSLKVEPSMTRRISVRSLCQP